ncbi:uncharacterized protein N7515_009935 [Penicillium bovifimosum]|uniref:Yeast cell wall synthesis Kre9/Knh1-like N-terminal domain-containing protein n=1 Tax=Penicillium bovifimosum TaxID=126998 RepID=A0A9W9KUL8_9EURO|nr:uncharacterized protein N7515_009935 [Penicillium bovifimosum]KAJ5120547.1 hypothetical protein N7515_009935 [Penicillium bovifimosum]
MRFFTTIAVAVLAAVASADKYANPFNIPVTGYTFKVGQPTTLSWAPTTSGTVTLYLQWGAVTTAGSGITIASGLENDGSYTWHVPSDLAAQPDYTIEIVSDEDSDDYNFLHRFTVEGATVSAPSFTASSTTTSSTSTETSTSTTETTSTSVVSTTSSSTLTTATSTTTPASTPASTSVTETSTSAAESSPAASTSASATETAQDSVPTTNAGVAKRVSGGMLALVAGAFML